MAHNTSVLLPELNELYEGSYRKKNRFSARRKMAFLELLLETGSFKDTCKSIGISPASVTYHRVTDKVFGAAVESVLAEIRPSRVLMAEDALYDRAVNGVVKGVYYKGERVDEERVYSDGLLQFYLESNNPERYGKKQTIDLNANVTDNSQAKASMLSKLGITLDEIEDGVYGVKDD